jgi:8-oxo-dGTP pyrophosphatase MutT (NUDIX family)
MKDNIPQVLMIRRRDSLGYVEFLRGRYTLSSHELIQRLIDQMTYDEHIRLMSKPFDDLWNILWNYQHTRQYRSEYEHAKQLFERLNTSGDTTGKTLSKYIEVCPTHWLEPEWGFPKGRRSQHETEFMTAVREFQEETGWKHTLPECAVDITPETEVYVGSNGISYRQVYYIGMVQEKGSDIVMDPGNRVQIREVSGVAWCSFEEGQHKIRITSPEKRAILDHLRTRISSILEVHSRKDISLHGSEDGRSERNSSHRGGGAGTSL